MARVAKTLVIVLTVAAICTPLFAQSPADAAKKAQAKALALRAARADAMRKLGERINGLSITSTTKVKDFVVESDIVKTALRTFLVGMRETEAPEFSEDGVCTVKLSVTLDEVIRALRSIRGRIDKTGSKFKAADFTKMTVTNKMKVITVLGSGAPKEAAEYAEAPLMIPDETGTVSLSQFKRSVKSYWLANCTGRGRLIAERAARVDAMRRLGERIKGVRIDSETVVKDYIVESDDMGVSMRTFLRGAKEIGVRYHSDELIVEVEMQVKLQQVVTALHTWA
ncbi:MAG: hypothetical protein J7M14_05210, partial [Planctomycetes bacterium]|nr:hypothetical protein [Planctomycetota bacterium]